MLAVGHPFDQLIMVFPFVSNEKKKSQLNKEIRFLYCHINKSVIHIVILIKPPQNGMFPCDPSKLYAANNEK